MLQFNEILGTFLCFRAATNDSVIVTFCNLTKSFLSVSNVYIYGTPITFCHIYVHKLKVSLKRNLSV